MHMISELSDHLPRGGFFDKHSGVVMITKRDLQNLEGLFLLSAIDYHSGKRKASQALNTSVDTINKYIDNLEDELGMKLLVNNGRGSTLTNEGRRIVADARKMRTILDNIYSLKHDTTEIKGDVRVYMSVGVNSSIIPQGIGEFFDQYPGLRIVSTSDTEKPQINVSDYDIVLTYDDVDSNDLSLVYARDVESGFFASSEYLSKHTYPLDLEDMLKNHRIITKLSPTLQVKNSKELYKRATHICYSANNTFAMIEVIKNHAGIGVMPLRFKDEGLVCLDNIPCDCPLKFKLLVNRDTKDIPKVRTVLNYFKGLMQKM